MLKAFSLLLFFCFEVCTGANLWNDRLCNFEEDGELKLQVAFS